MKRAVVTIVIAAMLAAIAPAPLHGADADALQMGKQAYAARAFAKAFQLLKPLAEAGNAEAQRLVGDMHNLGAGVAQDNSADIEWYWKSAMQGNAQAIEMLGQGMRLFSESTN